MQTEPLDLIIEGVTILDGSQTSIGIRGNRIAALGSKLEHGGTRVMNGTRKLALPGLVNAHTHASMSLFRGFADDLPLKAWLEEKIWPAEARLTEEDCYWGARLACAEMIRTGTTLFNDMYWHLPGVARAVKDSGLRAVLAAPIVSLFKPERDFRSEAEMSFKRIKSGEWGDRVHFALGPHAPYSVEPSTLEWCADFASRHNVMIHIHVSENGWEVDQCKSAHNGLRPVELLEKLQILKNRVILAHGVWLEPAELEILGKYPKASIAHCPVSNMKLASGAPLGKAFPIQAALKAGVRVALGTDGDCSNNNLDLFEEMKFAALLAKHATGDTTTLPAGEAFMIATTGGAEALGFEACGRLEKGSLADLVLVDLTEPTLAPVHDLTSHVVYAASGLAVDTTICDGKILMQGKKIPGLDEIVAKANEAAKRVCRN